MEEKKKSSKQRQRMKNDSCERSLRIFNCDGVWQWDLGLFISLASQVIWERQRAGLQAGEMCPHRANIFREIKKFSRSRRLCNISFWDSHHSLWESRRIQREQRKSAGPCLHLAHPTHSSADNLGRVTQPLTLVFLMCKIRKVCLFHRTVVGVATDRAC